MTDLMEVIPQHLNTTDIASVYQPKPEHCLNPGKSQNELFY